MIDDENETPPPHRSRQDGSIILPIDSEWFMQWRRELIHAIKEFRANFTSIDSRLHEGSISLFKHEEQISSLTKDQVATDAEVKANGLRIKTLEDSEKLRTQRETLDSAGISAQVKTTIILTAIATMTAGTLGLILFLIGLYAKSQMPAGAP